MKEIRCKNAYYFRKKIAGYTNRTIIGKFIVHIPDGYVYAGMANGAYDYTNVRVSFELSGSNGYYLGTAEGATFRVRPGTYKGFIRQMRTYQSS